MNILAWKLLFSISSIRSSSSTAFKNLRFVFGGADENEDKNDGEASHKVFQGSGSSNSSNDHGSRYIRSVERVYDGLKSSNSYTTTYAPVYSYNHPASSSTLPQSSLKLSTSSSIPARSWPKDSTPSNQSQFLRTTKISSSSKPSSLPPSSSTASSRPSPQAAKPSYKQSLLTPSPSTSSSKPAAPATISSSGTSGLPLAPSASSLKAPTQATISPSKPSQLAPKPSTSSLKSSPQAPPPPPPLSSSPSLYNLPTISLKPSHEPVPFAVKTSPSSPKASPLSPSSFKQPPSFKPTLSPASSNLINQQKKFSYIWVANDTSPIYAIPNDIKGLIEREKLPDVLKKPLSLLTYKDFFAALLYAEDFYIEKWSEFKLENTTLELQEAAIYKKAGRIRNTGFNESYEKDDKMFVAFDIESSYEKRPFLLSRDFVFARPSGQKTEQYQGIIYRVVKSTCVLVEFGEDFFSQHYSTSKYDISFSFNRVCLKRAHQAIEMASDPLFRSFLFPDCIPRKMIISSSAPHFYNRKLDVEQSSAVRQILSFQGSPPYLVQGPTCVTMEGMNLPNSKRLSRTGLVVQEAALQIYRSSLEHRILICAPINSTCDLLMLGFRNEIPESDMFRANAAFREVDGVPIDILPSCAYKGEYFSCPSLQELRKFRVILSTFVSSFRLHNEGICAGNFTHIFLVDASSATEPEAMVTLANLANEKTTVIVTGAPKNRSGWVRSDIARKYGLQKSYFERLLESQPYSSLDPNFITQLVDPYCKSKDI